MIDCSSCRALRLASGCSCLSLAMRLSRFLCANPAYLHGQCPNCPTGLLPLGPDLEAGNRQVRLSQRPNRHIPRHSQRLYLTDCLPRPRPTHTPRPQKAQAPRRPPHTRGSRPQLAPRSRPPPVCVRAPFAFNSWTTRNGPFGK
jgi:hypothetical protein